MVLATQVIGSSTGWRGKPWSASVLHLSPAGAWAGREGTAVSVRQADARPGLVESMIWMG